MTLITRGAYFDMKIQFSGNVLTVVRTICSRMICSQAAVRVQGQILSFKGGNITAIMTNQDPSLTSVSATSKQAQSAGSSNKKKSFYHL